MDTGAGPQPVEDIGEALQAVLDAYRQGTESMPGEASYAAAFSRDTPRQERAPTARDSAMAGRY